MDAQLISPILSTDPSFPTRSAGLVRIRPVRRSDEAALRDMFRRCSREDLRMRCFGISKSFPEVFAGRLARLGAGDEFALAAVMGSGEIGGVVHAVALPGSVGKADYDIMVRTDLKGRGIGSRLMREMLREANRAGFRAVGGDVMLGNRAMLLLAGDLGFRRVGFEGGVVRIETAPQDGDTGALPPEDTRERRGDGRLPRISRPVGTGSTGEEVCAKQAAQTGSN